MGRHFGQKFAGTRHSANAGAAFFHFMDSAGLPVSGLARASATVSTRNSSKGNLEAHSQLPAKLKISVGFFAAQAVMQMGRVKH